MQRIRGFFDSLGSAIRILSFWIQRITDHGNPKRIRIVDPSTGSKRIRILFLFTDPAHSCWCSRLVPTMAAIQRGAVVAVGQTGPRATCARTTRTGHVSKNFKFHTCYRRSPATIKAVFQYRPGKAGGRNPG